MREIGKIVYYIFFGIIVFIALLLIFSKIPLPGNYKVMVVLSGSMEPAIKTGSIVLVKPVREYKVGDVISYYDPSNRAKVITHRILKIEKTGEGNFYQTKGDANDAPDWEIFSEKLIIGKVLFSIPYLGYALNGIRHPIVFTLFIIVPSTIIIYEEVKNIQAELKKKKRYKKVKKTT